MTQLRQRIAVQTRLDALHATEVVRYINHRLQVAGYNGTELFTPGALGLIADRSRGIPRLINNLCFSALSLGCAMQQKQITSEVVRQAALDLSLETRAPKPPVPHQQTGPRVTHGLGQSLQSLYAWVTDNLFRRRVLQMAVFSLLCGSFVLCFRFDGMAGAVCPPASVYQGTQRGSAVAGHDAGPAQRR